MIGWLSAGCLSSIEKLPSWDAFQLFIAIELFQAGKTKNLTKYLSRLLICEMKIRVFVSLSDSLLLPQHQHCGWFNKFCRWRVFLKLQREWKTCSADTWRSQWYINCGMHIMTEMNKKIYWLCSLLYIIWVRSGSQWMKKSKNHKFSSTTAPLIYFRDVDNLIWFFFLLFCGFSSHRKLNWNFLDLSSDKIV